MIKHSFKHYQNESVLPVIIAGGIGNRIAHTCLGCQVDYNGGLILLKDAVDGGLVGYVALDEFPRRTGRNAVVQLVQTEFLQSDIIVVVHVVDAYDGGTLHILKQAFH